MFLENIRVNNKTHYLINLEAVTAALKRLLSAMGFPNSTLDCTFVTDRAMRPLNRRFRGKDKSTDVLSFPLWEAPAARRDAVFLGDLVIALETAERQALEYGKPFEEELVFLMIHGVLHLLGYDHETTDAEAKLMRKMEQKLLKAFKKEGPIQLVVGG